jgi:hypothetical protein
MQRASFVSVLCVSVVHASVLVLPQMILLLLRRYNKFVLKAFPQPLTCTTVQVRP